MPEQAPAHPLATRWWTRFTDKPFKTAWLLLSTVTATLTIVGGVLIRLADPSNIQSFGAGMWWSIQTVTTVGYGDVVPGTAPGRAIAVIVMITGIAFMTVTTAAVTNLFIEAARRQRGGDQVHDELAALNARVDQLLEEVRSLREDGRG